MVNVEELKKLMKTNKISFTYKKINGEVRQALGTLDLEYIRSKGGEPKGSLSNMPDDVLRYWDVNSDGWRSCRHENIESYVTPDASQKEIDF